MSARAMVMGLALAVVGATPAWAGFRCDAPEPRPQTHTASNCVYEVVLNDGLFHGWGAFTAATGPEHPVTWALGGRQSAGVARGFSLLPHTNAVSFRSWTSRTDYSFDIPGPSLAPVLLEDDGFTCSFSRDMARPEIREILREDGQPVGLEARFAVDDPDRLDLIILIAARGQTYEDSAVEVTATAVNRGDEEVRLGFRYAWVPGHLRSSQTALGLVPPDPPEEPWAKGDTTWVAPAMDHFHVTWTVVPSVHDPVYFSGTSVHGPWPLDPPPTGPDRIATSVDVSSFNPELRAGPFNTCYQWHGPDVPRGIGNGVDGTVESMAYFWGDTEESALVVPPGGSASVRVWYWAFLDKPLSCDAGGPYGPVECTGPATPAVLDGRASRTDSGALPLLRWSAADPDVAFDDATAPTPEVRLPGPGTHEVTLDVGTGPFTATCQATVEVVDTTPPVLRVPDPVVLPTSDFGPTACLLPVTLVAEAEDLCADDVTITHVTDPFLGAGGAVAEYAFPPGVTRVTFTATDPSGNSVTGQTTVTVIDDIPPWFVTLEATPAVLWPPNHRLVEVAVLAEATDNCDEPVAITLLEVVSSEPDNDRGDGHTTGDVQGAVPGTADFAFQLRAERDGRGLGRTYAIRYLATDEAGNETIGQTRVVVPHDMRGPRP